MYYKCRKFYIHELVTKKVFLQRGEKAWRLLDSRALYTLDRLKRRYPKGHMIINNYYWGGRRGYSGLRQSGDKHYSTYSGHSFGQSFDAIFNKYNVYKIREDILNNPNHADFKYITELETNISWLHFSVRNSKRITTYKPN